MTSQKGNDPVEAGEFRFQPFARSTGLRVGPTEPTVTIQKSGEIHVNSSAIELIGTPPAVELLYDPEKNALGMRPADPGEDNAYPRRADKNRKQAHLFAGRAFALFHELDLRATRRYPAEVVDGILVADLNAGVESGSPGSREKSA
jgi:hypothetical protein